MSDFTTQLRFICESYAKRYDKPQPQSDVDSIIEASRPLLFDFDYPIFDEAYKKTLETKIISHYYTREIGQETVGLFKLRLKNKMREIMPYYNQLYLSERLKFDPFINTEYADSRNTMTSDKKTTEGLSENSRIGSQENQANRDVTTHSEDENERFHDDQSTGSKTADTESISNESGRTTTTGHDELEKKGKEKNKPAGTTVKHSDTPLGSVSNVTGDGSNYLSDVTQTEYETGETTFENRKDVTDSSSDSNSSTGRNEDTTSVEQTEGANSGFENSNGKSDATTNEGSSSIGTSMEEGQNSHNETETGQGTSDYFGRLFGKTGSETYSEMLNKFRSTFLNIDMDVISELENLFMLVW